MVFRAPSKWQTRSNPRCSTIYIQIPGWRRSQIFCECTFRKHVGPMQHWGTSINCCKPLFTMSWMDMQFIAMMVTLSSRAERAWEKSTKKGWRLFIQWEDGSTSWEKLADRKESNSIEVAEYTIDRGHKGEPYYMLGGWNTLARREITSSFSSKVKCDQEEDPQL